MSLSRHHLLFAWLLVTAAPGTAKDWLAAPWKTTFPATQRFEINGTEGRNNPLRTKLAMPYASDELFVRYRIRYEAASIDTPTEDEGEFFVLWLDTTEGGDQSPHTGSVPNIGVHVSGDSNKFMVRYHSKGEKFGKTTLQGDRDFLIVARLWKSQSGAEMPFDQLDLWVDPDKDAELAPHASAPQNAQAISSVNWIGFSTGGKTEVEDRIFVWDVNLSESWQGILDLPPKPETPQKLPPREPTIHFEKDVLPILESRCFSCHEGEDAKKDVRLDLFDEVLNLTTPGNPEASSLFDLVSSGEMPPKKKKPLSEAEIKILRTWIEEGLAWDETLLPTPVPKTDHWAFQAIQNPAIPVVKNSGWIRTPVDAFIARQHEKAKLSPAPPAAPSTLQRRLSLDVLGLPPEQTPTTIDALLEDPGYGERWGRHWLDVARWAESNGHQHNRDRLHAWRYRDWVIQAFNEDMPYDHFVLAQIAGDEIRPLTDQNLAATGFLSAARYSGNELDKEIQRNDILVDIVNTTGKAFLGLTMECAQCHTHKFDPISIRDYYRMQAFFEDGQPGNVAFTSHLDKANELVTERWAIYDRTLQRRVAIRQKQGIPNASLIQPTSVVKSMTKADRDRFTFLDQEISQLPQAWGFSTPTDGSPIVTPHEMRWPLQRDEEYLRSRETRLLLRGDVKAPGPVVEPGWPRVFGQTPSIQSTPRKELAAWMGDPQNPLVARVWVNRIWQWHFGRGLVETSADFGTQGTTPTHPELLDFLASELIAQKWSTKHIHRLILDSATYRQSSQFSENNARIDPENRLLWRWTPRRLEAEAVRDSMLALSGQLDLRRGGPSDSPNSKTKRRSIYLKQKRDNLPEQQLLFDSATGIVSCTKRRVSTTSLQPLWLLNSKFSHEVAAGLAARTGSVEAAFSKAMGRAPSEEEISQLDQLASSDGLQSACLAILNASEFLYIP